MPRLRHLIPALAGAATLASALGAQGRDRTLWPDTTFFAEGLDVDPRTGTLYITSLQHGSVLAVDRAGSTQWFVAPGSLGHIGISGVAVDTARGLAWLTTARHPRDGAATAQADSPPASLHAVRLADGAPVARWVLGDGSGAAGELAVTTRGEVLVSDGLRGTLYRLRSPTDSLRLVASASLRSPQGIAPDADGRRAWVADWSRGLFVWDLATDSITPVTDANGRTLRGIDGLRRHGTALIAIVNGQRPQQVVAIALSPDGRTIQQVRAMDAPATYPGEPTVGSILDGVFHYITSSAWPFWDAAGARRQERGALPAVIVRSVPLDR